MMKQEKFKKVRLNDVPHIAGLSIEAPESYKSHRLVKGNHDDKNDLYYLDYSIMCIPFKDSPYKTLSGNFFDNVKKRNQDTSRKIHAENQYDNFFRNRFSPYQETNLDEEEFVPTLTFKFKLDSQFNLKESTIEATAGKVSERFDYYHANKAMTAGNPDENLIIWHKFMQNRTGDDGLMQDGTVNFHRLVEKTNGLIEETALNFCLEEQAETLFRVHKSTLPTDTDIKSVVCYMNTSEILERDITPDVVRMPITSYNEKPSLLNGAVIYQFLATGDNAFQPDEMAGFAAMAGGRKVTTKNPRFKSHYMPEM